MSVTLTPEILVERVTESGFCNAIGVGRCPHFIAKKYEPTRCRLWPDEILRWHLEGFLCCPQCRSTPTAPALTEEQEAAVKYAGMLLRATGNISRAKQLRAAFPEVFKEAPHD